MVYHDSRVYVVVCNRFGQEDTEIKGTEENGVFVHDAETGEETGKVEVGQAVAPAGPVIINETMFMGSQDSYVYAVPLTDFEQNGEEHKNLTVAPSDEGFTKSDYIIYSILAVFLLGIIVVLVISFRKNKNK